MQCLKASGLLQVSWLGLVPHVTGRPVAVATTEEAVYLLKAGEPERVLHSVYGQPITCLDVTGGEAAFGVKGFGWLLNETNQVVKAGAGNIGRDCAWDEFSPQVDCGPWDSKWSWAHLLPTPLLRAH